MSEQVYLSFWLRGFTQHNLLRHMQKALSCFPFSRLRPEALLRIHALEFAEPPLFERRFEEDTESDQVIAAASDFVHADCAYQLECWWDIMQLERDWKLAPAKVTITCFGPLFPSEWGEQLQIEFGHDTPFMPDKRDAASLVAVRSNIRSLLHLAEEIGRNLPVEKHTLWSETGQNLAQQLQAALDQT